MRSTESNSLDKLLSFIEKYYYVFLMLVLSLTLFNLFYYLGETPIYSWDEARHGVSAYEMVKNNDFIVNTYGYKNDYWNLKPPVSFWAIALGYKIAGFNPLGLRLFSAVAALLTIFIAAMLVKYKHGAAASLICVLILTTSPKYIVIHSARTGDADALFVLFFTVAMISMILIEKNRRFLYLAGLAFSLAFLTKSWHALSIALTGFIYLLFTKTLFKLKIKEWILFILSSFSPILIWGILRYSRDGFEFFNMMINYDLLARTSRTLEGHIGNKWFYVNTLRSYYSMWFAILILGLFIYYISNSDLIKKDKINTEKRNYYLALILWILVPLLAYSKASTKIYWYIYPVYIPIAIAVSGICGALIRGVRRNAAVQLAVIISLLVGAGTYETVILKHIVQFKNDSKRVNIQNIHLSEDIRGADVYVYYGADAKINVGPISEMKDWEQSDLLSAEFYWDLVPKDGGFKAFLKDGENSVILVPKRKEFTKVIEDNKLRVISDSGSMYILTKNKSSFTKE